MIIVMVFQVYSLALIPWIVFLRAVQARTAGKEKAYKKSFFKGYFGISLSDVKSSWSISHRIWHIVGT